MIDANERAVMEQTVRGAIKDAVATADGGAGIDAVLAKLGWLEMLDDHPDDAIGIVFTVLGAANATATALDDVIASALGQKPRADLAVLLPRFSAWDPPGAEGLATARAASADEILVASGSALEPWLASVRITAREVRTVRGVDPDAGLHA